MKTTPRNFSTFKRDLLMGVVLGVLALASAQCSEQRYAPACHVTR